MLVITGPKAGGDQLMKNLAIVSCACVVLASSAAMAADMPVKAPYLKAPPPAYSWTGCYLGGYVGGAQAGDAGHATDVFFVATGAGYNGGSPFPLSYNTGFMGGGTLGCNYQTGMFVFGLEGEGGYLHETSSFQWPFDGGTSHDTNYSSTIGNWYAVAAGRFGVAVDRVMFYAKGGAAWTNVNSTINDSCVTPGVCGVSTFSGSGGISNALGYAIGGGIEWAFASNWTLKAEGLYMGFTKTYSVCGVTGAPGPGGFPAGLAACGSESIAGIMTAKIGLNYKFDWGGPVVARY
jgi:outer membrane immunogenic protein